MSMEAPWKQFALEVGIFRQGLTEILFMEGWATFRE
jgi:hypothetical protein